MKFRPKFGLVWLALLFLGVTEVIQSTLLFRRNKPIAEACAALILVGMAAGLLVYRSVYWELTPGCLIVRKFWRKRKIPWIEVTRVGWLGGFSGTLSVSIGHRIEDYDRLYFEPSDQAALIAALRKFALQASFEIDQILSGGS